jgi:zinc D-Ala-D-Ala carboxypeptidase
MSNQPNISKHITYQEATHSSTGESLGIANVPGEKVLAVMRITAEKIFEPLRCEFGPIIILSFFRSVAVNKAVGGATNSQHLTGEAIDIQATGNVTNAELFHYIKENLEFDQVIWEFGNSLNPQWVHVSFSKRNRKQALRAVKKKVAGKSKTVYEIF